MEKLEKYQKEITESLKIISDEKISVEEALNNFKLIDKYFKNLYNNLEVLNKLIPFESNEEIKHFSLINNEINLYLKSFIPKSERYEINYEVIKFLNTLFDVKYFYILNDMTNTEQEKIIIDFCHTCLKIVFNFRKFQIFELLIRKIHFYLNYVFQKNKNLRPIINELMNGFCIPHTRNFKDFKKNLKESKLIEKCASDSSKLKEEGINELAKLISSDVNFAEQFELLTLVAPDIINSLLKVSSSEYAKAYGRFGNLLCSLLYTNKFKCTLDIYINKTNNNIYNQMNNDNTVIKSNFNTDTDNFKMTKNIMVGENYGKKLKNVEEEELILDNVHYILEDKLVKKENLLEKFGFLEKKLYELTYQKEILDLNEQIVEICLLYVNLIIKYDKIFPLQYISYSILKRVYFNFPKFIPEIGDSIVKVLSNLCKFQGQFEWNLSLESRQFAYYLLSHDKNLCNKIKSATSVASFDITYQNFILQKTNLTIGFNNWVTVFAGKIIEREIDAFENDSIIYISINMEEDEDKEISIIVDKFNPEKNFWDNCLHKEEIGFSDGLKKIIIYSKNPARYRIQFDNTDSWVSTKTVLYRVVYLKPSPLNK